MNPAVHQFDLYRRPGRRWYFATIYADGEWYCQRCRSPVLNLPSLSLCDRFVAVAAGYCITIPLSEVRTDANQTHACWLNPASAHRTPDRRFPPPLPTTAIDTVF